MASKMQSLIFHQITTAPSKEVFGASCHSEFKLIGKNSFFCWRYYGVVAVTCVGFSLKKLATAGASLRNIDYIFY